MPIQDILQPELIVIDDTLRLRRLYTDSDCDFALPWYQDKETVLLVDGVKTPYDREKLYRMYRFLDGMGELYWIEARASADTAFVPIGDITFCKEDLPIVIGEKQWRKKGIGRRVIGALIERAKALGYPTLSVQEIYFYNIGSQRMFESVGFVPCERTEKGISYRLEL